MASSSSGSANLAAQFKNFASKGDDATSKDITRWCTDAGVFKGSKTCTSNNLDIAFSVVKQKGKNTISVKELKALIKSISKQYAKDHKLSEGEAEAKLTEMLAACSKAAHGATKISKTGGVGRMTDTSKYTGAHKERFDESGQGKGIAGREDIADNTGYVGQYKGAGTYDEKQRDE